MDILYVCTQGRRSRHLQPLADVSNQTQSFPHEYVTAPYINRIFFCRYTIDEYCYQNHTMILSPRYHLFEIGDQPWCPEWVRAYIQSYLTEVWNLHIPPFSKSSPAGVAADLIVETLSNVSSYTFVDLCAGAGGPTGTIENILNRKLETESKQAAQFVLTDLYPRLEEWAMISKRQENVSFIAEPLDATRCERIASRNGKECRIFNLCFHHFDDHPASTILRKAIESADAIM